MTVPELPGLRGEDVLCRCGHSVWHHAPSGLCAAHVGPGACPCRGYIPLDAVRLVDGEGVA